MRQIVATTVFGEHAEQLDQAFASFQQLRFAELHAFVVGDRLPTRRVSGITYHVRAPDPAFLQMYRDVNFRRWLFIEEVEADYALVVDGHDVLCLQSFPEMPMLLKGAMLGAVVEHPGGRYLEGGLYTGNYLNAGVTLWDVKASQGLRRAVLERGLTRYRSPSDDQRVLNEIVHAHFLDNLTILPTIYNYRPLVHRHVRGWPRVESLAGVRIYHSDEWRLAKAFMPVAPFPPLAPLERDTHAPSRWMMLWRAVRQRFRPDLVR